MRPQWVSILTLSSPMRILLAIEPNSLQKVSSYKTGNQAMTMLMDLHPHKRDMYVYANISLNILKVLAPTNSLVHIWEPFAKMYGYFLGARKTHEVSLYQ